MLVSMLGVAYYGNDFLSLIDSFGIDGGGVKKSRFKIALILCYFPSRIVHPILVGSCILGLGGGGGIDLLFGFVYFLFIPPEGAVTI